jgi:cytochrome P450
MTFVLNPHDVAPVLRHHEELESRAVKYQIGERAFGMSRETMAQVYTDQNKRKSEPLLKGDALAPLTSRLGSELMRHVPVDGNGGLFEMVSRWIFEASIGAFWGQKSAPLRGFKDFQRFDQSLPLLISGVPASMLGLSATRRRLIAMVSDVRPNPRAALREYEATRSSGLAPHDRDTTSLGFLWALLANTMPAAFWTTAFLLANSEARVAVMQEVAGLGVPPRVEDLAQTPVLDSVINETLRLKTGSLVVRSAPKDFELALASSRWAIRADDWVCIYPWITHHDAEIFAEPEIFRYDRFCAEVGKARFFKNSQRVVLALMPYGGGSDLCPGRFLAHQEIKIFITCLLQTLDIELLAALPRTLNRRCGLGVLPPESDLPARWVGR